LQTHVQKQDVGRTVPTEGINVMRVQLGRYLLSVLLPAAFLLGAGSGAVAQQSHAHADTAVEMPAVATGIVRWSS
jgi:hypothetical protein